MNIKTKQSLSDLDDRNVLNMAYSIDVSSMGKPIDKSALDEDQNIRGRESVVGVTKVETLNPGQGNIVTESFCAPALA